MQISGFFCLNCHILIFTVKMATLCITAFCVKWNLMLKQNFMKTAMNYTSDIITSSKGEIINFHETHYLVTYIKS